MNAAGDNTLVRLLARRVAQTPAAVAYRIENRAGGWDALSWGDFGARVARLRRSLQAAGLRRGDRLALIAPVSFEWETLHHAALALGAVVVGLDGHDLPERIAAMADVADITAWAVTQTRPLAQLSADRRGRARLLIALAALDGHGLDGLPPARRWDELLAPARDGGDDAADAAVDTGAGAPAPGDEATVIFTSGTTGAPKGIAYSHGQLCLAVDRIGEAYSFAGAQSRLLCWLPLSNLFQRIVNLAAMRQGAATSLLADPRRVMEVVAQVEPEIFIGVPRFYEKLYEGIRANIAAQPAWRRRIANWAWDVGRRAAAGPQGSRAPSALARRLAERLVLARVRAVMGTRLRCMVSGSAPMPRLLLDELRALGWLVLEAYGLSENVMPMAMNRLDDYRLGSVGRPMPGNEIVVDAEGAIKVRGAGLFRGYLGDAGPAPFDAEGYYATGDLGAIDADGYLRLTGRSGDLIKTSTGRRVAPAGIEARLGGLPGIDQVMVVGNGRKGLVALCTCSGADDAAARATREFALRARVATLGEHERPLAVALLRRPFSIDAGELTPNLKLRRAAIEQRHAALIQSAYERADSSPAGAGLPIV
ncbi:MAG: AMP-binding protein [Burkholderiales bacterium]|nr:AMP-binding protein [Burkholderiales bacterium]MDE1925699.1 AMP-binding protein [Burkholderiales bacterium]MDE2157617.1 AMP-binding protein [Burkholderiales bacterium]MDE2504178.1 AMP-binding protein [Burkholderiales bacterium]